MTRVMAFVGAPLLAAALALAWAAPPDEAKGVSDEEFVAKASAAGLAEMNFGRLAAEQAAGADVKKFGQTMVDDHSKANEELNRIADKKQIRPAPRMDANHLAAFDKLIGMRGADFDKAYLAGQVADHKEAVALFEAEADGGKDADLKAFAAKTLPTIKSHLDMAQKLAGGAGEKEKEKVAEKDKGVPVEPKTATVEGKFGSYADGVLTVMDKEGKPKEFKVEKAVKPVTTDGKEAKWDDVKKDDKVIVTTSDGKVTKVEFKAAGLPPPPPPKSETFEGKVVEAKEGKLTISVDGKDKSFDVKDVKPAIDGKEGKWDDVKKGGKVKVTTKDGAVTKVEAEGGAPPPPPPPPDKAATTEGKFIEYKDGKLTVADKDKERTFDVKDVKPQIDGKDGKWDDLKKDDKVAVTTDKDGKVTKVEKK